MQALLRCALILAVIASVLGPCAAKSGEESAASRNSCRVSFGDSSSTQPISILQVVVADGLEPCADAILTTIGATLTCSAPALAPISIWPMFIWKSHENDSPKHISSFDSASSRAGASMTALGSGISTQPLHIPVLLPPAICGVGILQARFLHPLHALL
jgi:hypothetical protein